jgi:hypothetical protein
MGGQGRACGLHPAQTLRVVARTAQRAPGADYPCAPLRGRCCASTIFALPRSVPPRGSHCVAHDLGAPPNALTFAIPSGRCSCCRPQAGTRQHSPYVSLRAAPLRFTTPSPCSRTSSNRQHPRSLDTLLSKGNAARASVVRAAAHLGPASHSRRIAAGSFRPCAHRLDVPTPPNPVHAFACHAGMTVFNQRIGYLDGSPIHCIRKPIAAS